MRRSVLVALSPFFAMSIANAQTIDWDMKGAQALSQPVNSLSGQDQQGILRQLKMEPSDLVALKVETASGHIFLVQGVYRIGGICGANNCDFWILSSDYKILLKKVTQMYKLQSRTHDGLPDIVTSMHASAFESSLSYWRFQGSRYVRVACADAVYADADGNVFQKPHISPHPCGTGG